MNVFKGFDCCWERLYEGIRDCFLLGTGYSQDQKPRSSVYLWFLNYKTKKKTMMLIPLKHLHLVLYLICASILWDGSSDLVKFRQPVNREARTWTWISCLRSPCSKTTKLQSVFHVYHLSSRIFFNSTDCTGPTLLGTGDTVVNWMTPLTSGTF